MLLGVLASGTGSILDALLTEGLEVAVVVCDRPCGALDIASRHGVPARLVHRASFGPDFDRDAYTLEVAGVLRTAGVDLVASAGFGTIMPRIVDHYPGRMLNTHPSLLPAFPGWHAVRDALEHGVKITGCTVFVVTEGTDDGPIVAQEPVRVLPDDTESTLHERIKAVERWLFPATIHEYMAGLPVP